LREPKFADFPRNEYEMRYERAREIMERNHVDALLITGKENLRYFTGMIFEAWAIPNYNLMALLSRDAGVVLFPGIGNENVVLSSWIDDVRYLDEDIHGDSLPVRVLSDTIREKGLDNASIGMEIGREHHLRMAQIDFELLKKNISSAKIVDASDILWEIRRIKSEAEIAKIRKSCQITCKALSDGFEGLREGMTEREFAAIVKSSMFEHGATEICFFAVQFGEKAMWPDTYPVDNKARRGDMIYFDGGCVYDGYYCDMKRLAVIGNPSPEQKRNYDLMLRLHTACIDAVRPGALVSDVSRVWLDIVRKEGMSKFADGLQETFRAVGHSTGLNIHERPSITVHNKVPFEPNMVCCIEPLITHDGYIPYHKAKWKYSIEDVVLITGTGTERLTQMTDDLRVI
jgi:Xaa-Pro aminopeptidase